MSISKILKQVAAISFITFKELIREKILWSALMFAFLCVGLAFAVSQLSFTDNSRIALDFGMTAVSLVGGLISVIMGSAMIAKEVQNRTLYLVLTKSIWRWQFVVGRFFGLLSVLVLNSLIMTSIMVAVFLLSGGVFSSLLIKNTLLQITEFGILAATACVFSSFSTSTLAAIISSGVWIIGHAMTDLKLLSEKIEPVALRPILSFVTKILPDLSPFDIKVQVSHHLTVTWGYTGVSMLYGVAYIGFALILACLVFVRRDL